MRIISTALFVTTLLLGVGFGRMASAKAGAYMKLGDIKGDVTEVNHVDWTQLEAFSANFSRQTTTNATGAVTSRTAPEFTVVKSLDRGSPALLERIANAKAIPTLEIHLTTTAGDGAQPVYLKYELKNVLISSYSVSGSGGSSAAPSEQLSLNFEEIRMTYLRLDPRSGRLIEEVVTSSRFDPIKP